MLKKRERKSSLSIGKNKVEENEEEFEKINKKKQKIVDSQEEDEFQTLGIHPAIVNKLKEKTIEQNEQCRKSFQKHTQITKNINIKKKTIQKHQKNPLT